ncbi:hypothetical protein V6N13_043820 [Hibiscus sabdariffa]|uniref:Uncharacterized protein n=1 Tax=Hibiscus sabdariffa TaxID=183260 RepID=A0ABR2RGT1_9ROSI
MRSQPTVTGSGAGRRASRPYGRLLGRQGGDRLGEKRAPTAPSHRAEFGLTKQRRKRDVASTAGWLRLPGRSFGNGNGDRRCVWCGAKRLGKMPTGDGNIDDGGRICGCIGLRFRVDLY